MSIPEASATASTSQKLTLFVGVPIATLGFTIGGVAVVHSPVAGAVTPAVASNQLETLVPHQGVSDEQPFEIGDPMPQYVPPEWVAEVLNSRPHDGAPFDIGWDESD